MHLCARSDAVYNSHELSAGRYNATSALHCIPPRGNIVLAESKLAPADPLLDYQQASYTKRRMAGPKEHHGPEEVLERRGIDLTERLRESSFVGGDEKPEEMR